MKERDFLTVTEINAYLHNILQGDHLLWNVVIKGEISNVKLHNDNLYCTLKDKNSQISLLFFKFKGRVALKEGDNIIAEGEISYYVKTGKVTFVAKEIEICGLGLQYENFILLKNKLLKEGFFDDKYKIKPPILPLNICVITSKAGSVIKDINSTIRKNNSYINVSVYDVSVQGSLAVEDIIDGLQYTDKLNYDAIILARGGGSFEDLDAFNSERVVKQIFATNTFLISAVGHETDVTLSDLVADVRCLTPTAAANYVISLFNSTVQKIQNLISNMEFSTDKKIIASQKQLFKHTKMIRHLIEVKTIKREALISQISTRIQLQDPKMVMQKGYFRIALNGKAATSIGHFSENDSINIMSYDGTALATINKIIKKSGDN